MPRPTLAALATLAAVASTHAAPRDIQIRSINLETSVVELHNFGDVDEPAHIDAMVTLCMYFGHGLSFEGLQVRLRQGC